MEHDFFKRYIQEHKEAFEDESLPPNMLGNILGNLKERQAKKAKKKVKLVYTWLAVACSLLVIAGTYLFISQEGTKTISTDNQLVTNEKQLIEQPIVSKVIQAPIRKTSVVNVSKKTGSQPAKPHLYQEIYEGLADSLSVASRLDAIIKANTLAAISTKLKTELCQAFNEDENDNVRLAALGVLSKFSKDKYVQAQLVNGLSLQKDPVVQLELVKIMANNNTPETTDKLIAIANNPLTISAVKEQVYYALLTNDN